MTRKTQKQQAWQERRCDLYRLLPAASPQCAACRRRRHQLARLYSFCTKRHLQLCAVCSLSIFATWCSYTAARQRPSSGAFGEARIQVLRLLFLALTLAMALVISNIFQYKCRMMTFDPQTQCLNDQEQHAWFPPFNMQAGQQEIAESLSHIY